MSDQSKQIRAGLIKAGLKDPEKAYNLTLELLELCSHNPAMVLTCLIVVLYAYKEAAEKIGSERIVGDLDTVIESLGECSASMLEGIARVH